MRHFIILCFTLLFWCACDKKMPQSQVEELPPVFPDYIGVTVPANIAPLNFGIKDATDMRVAFSCEGTTLLEINGDDYIDIPLSEWKELLSKCRGKDVDVSVSAWNQEHPDGIRYRDFTIHIDDSEIDDYVAYRLIPPGYVGWNKMAIMQRHLSTFEETPIITNNENEGGCINCHNFCKGDPKRYMLHARNKGGGTIVVKDGIMTKRNIAMGSQNATYPNWHPGGRYIAFSVNDVHQSFYSHCTQKIEVFDFSSDLVIYDSDKDSIIEDCRFTDTLSLETFPAFSPDGRMLYFCSAEPHLLPYEVDSMHYSILRVPFDEKTGKMGSPVDTVYNARTQGGSACHPRVSPDGRYLMISVADCGTFTIHHPEADLILIDLMNGDIYKPDNINSDTAPESYHNWSSNGKWVTFASRRLEGRTTNLYFSHFINGQFTKSFLLPQKNPWKNEQRFFSYNVPEFITGKVNADRDQMSKMLQSKK